MLCRNANVMPLASGSTAQTSPSSLLPQAVLRFGLSGALWVGGSTGRRFLASSSPVPLSDMSRLALFPCFPPSFASSPPVLLFPSPLLAPPGRPYSHPSPPPCILFHPTMSKAHSGGGRGSRGASTIRYTKLTHPALGVLLAGDSVRRWGHPRCSRGRRRCPPSGPALRPSQRGRWRAGRAPRLGTPSLCCPPRGWGRRAGRAPAGPPPHGPVSLTGGGTPIPGCPPAVAMAVSSTGLGAAGAAAALLLPVLAEEGSAEGGGYIGRPARGTMGGGARSRAAPLTAIAGQCCG